MSADFLDAVTVVPGEAPRDLGADRDTRPPKPCCKRIRSAAGAAQWCGLPDPHPGQDCHGLGPSEMPVNTYAKGKR